MQPEHEILEQLQIAFPSEPIDSTGAFADWGTTYPDAAPYKVQLEGKTWGQLDRAYLVRKSDALGFLGTRHLVAVLPVYLCAMVEEGAGSPATEMLTLLLAKPLHGEDTGLGHVRFKAFVEAMTGAQRTAVACALDAFARNDLHGSLGRTALRVLDSYWNTYLPSVA